MRSVLSGEYLQGSVPGSGKGAILSRLLSGALLALVLVPTAFTLFLLDITGRFSEAYPGLGHAFSLLATGLFVLFLLALLVGVARVRIRRTRFTVFLFLLVGLAIFLPIHPEVGTDMRTISAEWRQRLSIPDGLLDRYYYFIGSHAGMEPQRITVTAPVKPLIASGDVVLLEGKTPEARTEAALPESAPPGRADSPPSPASVTGARVINMPQSLAADATLHEHPALESTVVGNFPAGYGLWVLEEMSNGWLMVEHEDGVAYVHPKNF